MSRLSRFIHFFADEDEDNIQRLPAGYKRLVGLGFNNNTFYEITGFNLRGSDTVKFSFSSTAACNVFGCYTDSSAQDNYSLYLSTTSGNKYLRYNGGTYLSYLSNANKGVRFDVTITPTGTYGMPDDSTWAEKSFTASANMCIGTSSSSTTSSKMVGNLYGNFEVKGRFKGIPCERESDNVLGYYDTYSKTFYEPTGNGVESLGYA